jgi:hypothetical protein
VSIKTYDVKSERQIEVLRKLVAYFFEERFKKTRIVDLNIDSLKSGTGRLSREIGIPANEMLAVIRPSLEEALKNLTETTSKIFSEMGAIDL